MDKIVRIRECDTCCMPVHEKYIGRQPVQTPLMFENKLTSIVFVSPEGASTKYNLCSDCANAVQTAIENMLNLGRGRVS